jgi:hypothetical protein
MDGEPRIRDKKTGDLPHPVCETKEKLDSGGILAIKSCWLWYIVGNGNSNGDGIMIGI